jgi:hypothetical protein
MAKKSFPTQPVPPEPNWLRVRVAECCVVSTQGPRGSQLVTQLAFSSGRKIVGPLLLDITQTRILIEDLQRVLRRFVECCPWMKLPAHQLGAVTDFPSEGPPPSGEKSNPKIVIPQPSRHPNSSRRRIHSTEVWQLHRLLKNVKSHNDFLKFIGAADETPTPVNSAAGRGKKRATPPASRRK